MSRLRPFDKVLATLFVLSFSVDFKGPEGGTPAQYAMAATNTIAFLLLTLRFRLAPPKSRLSAFVTWGWSSFLIAGCVGAAFGAVPFDRFIRTIYPFVLFIESFLVAYLLSRFKEGLSYLTSTMILAAFISLCFTVYWGFNFSGRKLETIRYQILSPITPFIIVVSGVDLLVFQCKRLRAVMLMLLSAAVIGLSVTRGMILSVAMAILPVMAILLWNWLRLGKISVPRYAIRAFGWGVLIAGAVLLSGTALAPIAVDRWIRRNLGLARGVTLITRYAAVIGQWEQISEKPIAWIFGRGFGQTYYYHEGFYPIVLPYVSPEMFAAGMWYPGEFMWVTPIYYGGFIFGFIANAVLLAGAFSGLRLLAALHRSQNWRYPANRSIWIGVLGYFSILGLGFTANPFISRLSAQFLGLTLGLVVAMSTGMLRTQSKKA